MAISKSTDEVGGSGEVLLTRMDANGDCWGHDAAERAIRVRGAVPGDWIALTGAPQRAQVRRDFTLVRAASQRRAAPCAVQARCGGCRLMPLATGAQRSVKLEMLRTELASRGIAVPELEWRPAPSSLGYRNRIRLRIEGGAFRFFNASKADDCSVLEPSLRAAIERLRALPRLEGLDGFDHCEVRSADLDGRPALSLSEGSGAAPDRDVLAELCAQLPDFLVGVSGDEAIPSQRRRLGGLDVFVPLDAFLQVNDAVNERLVEWAVEWVRSLGVRSVLDLFAGAGNFSLPLAAAQLSVSAVERHAASVKALTRSASRAGLVCEGIAAPADGAVAALLAAERRFDCVLVDAPRAGAGPLLSGIAALGARFVLLCSCYAPGLARDLEALLAVGFRLRSVTAWDMFPETHHLESVALLAKD